MDPERQDLYAYAFPEDPVQPSLKKLILTEPIAITGLILIVTYTIAAIFALDLVKKLKILQKPKNVTFNELAYYKKCLVLIGNFLNNFNNFWYTHQLFIVFYMMLIVHPYPHIPNEREEWAISDTWVWIMIPVFIYLAERIFRMMSAARDTSIISAQMLSGTFFKLFLIFYI